MLKGLDEQFEEEKDKKCVVCGGVPTHKCNEMVGSILCNASLCDSSVCNYVHNLKVHPKNHKLVQEYEVKLTSQEKLKALESELAYLNQKKKYYQDMMDKSKHEEVVYKMFRDLVIGKDNEIKQIILQISKIEKELSLTKYA